MKNLYYNTEKKTEVITTFLIPAMGRSINLEASLVNELLMRCRFHHGRKYGTLENPGPRNEGHVWFTIDAMCQHYFYNPEKAKKIGTRIWHKRQFIFDASSLLEGTPRRDTLELLEKTDIISMSYADLDELMDRYKDIKTAIKELSIKYGFYFQHKSEVVGKQPLPRVKQFIEENEDFLKCSTQEIQAMHVNLSREGYRLQLIRLGLKGKNSASK